MSDKESLPPELDRFATSVSSEDDSQGLARAFPQEEIRIRAEEGRQRFELGRMAELNRQRMATEGEKTKRIGILLIFLTLVAVLIYAGTTKDTVLPEKIIDVFVGAIAGLGAGSAIAKGKDR